MSKIRAALLLSRPPLITPTPAELETTYHAYQGRLRSALSNPVPSNFYFKAGSLPLRRFQRANHLAETAAFGPRLAGKAPDVGDLPVEPPAEVVPRDSWAIADQGRGESSLERHPESEVYCLIQDGGNWTFPSTEVTKGEGLDEAVKRALLGKEGMLGGETMDSWVVARKPVGVVQNVGHAKDCANDRRSTFEHIFSLARQNENTSG